jgi:hypothetical protein
VQCNVGDAVERERCRRSASANLAVNFDHNYNVKKN